MKTTGLTSMTALCRFEHVAIAFSKRFSRSRFATRVHSPPDITRRNHRSASEHIGRGYTLESRILLEVIERKGNRYLVRAKICLALIGFHKRSKIIVFERYSILIVCEFTSSGYNEILIKNVDRLFVKI